MNRNTVLIILRFSIVIALLALVLFFIVDVNAPEFIALCLTLLSCTLVYFFGICRLSRDEFRPLGKKGTAMAIGIYLAVLLVCVAVRLLTIFL